jgi:4-hydroxy-tetrahydrodipicolinate reductase
VTLRVAVFGLGRLGREIVALAPDRGVTIVGTFGRSNVASPDALRDSKADVAIDVSVAEAVEKNADSCRAAGVPLVIGVTGWERDADRILRTAAESRASMLIAANFSIGATLFSVLVSDAARRFSASLGFDAALVETHHAMKKDAPSGTARSLAGVALRSRGTEVPVTSVRVGHVPGVHSLVLDSAFEQVTLTHEARDRRVFADGALLAARWLRGRTGVFSMVDVVRDLTGELP